MWGGKQWGNFDFFKEVGISVSCTIAGKINVTYKVAYLPISKLHTILAVANLLAYNNKS